MEERVTIISGKKPVILIAPHGYYGDDERTGFMAKYIAESLSAYAVINNGWKRDDIVDCLNDKADCNNIHHCHEDVVKEEFLEPILRFKKRILQKHNNLNIFYIHGMSNRHRDICGDEKLGIVVGYGKGNPNSYTCDKWRKDALIYLLEKSGIRTYEGSKGGPMSGWARSNMNQLFRKWYHDLEVQSFQLEIVHKLREDKEMAEITAHFISDVIREYINYEKFDCSFSPKAY